MGMATNGRLPRSDDPASPSTRPEGIGIDAWPAKSILLDDADPLTAKDPRQSNESEPGCSFASIFTISPAMAHTQMTTGWVMLKGNLPSEIRHEKAAVGVPLLCWLILGALNLQWAGQSGHL